jgi:hypothetical protein
MILSRILTAILLIFVPAVLFGTDDGYDTISIKPIGLDYSKYHGINKLYVVGECEGMTGNQVVIFQNRPSFDFFNDDQEYSEEQKELEKALWLEILDKDAKPIVVMGRWHRYNDKMVFVCHQILRMNKHIELTQRLVNPE